MAQKKFSELSVEEVAALTGKRKEGYDSWLAKQTDNDPANDNEGDEGDDAADEEATSAPAAPVAVDKPVAPVADKTIAPYMAIYAKYGKPEDQPINDDATAAAFAKDMTSGDDPVIRLTEEDKYLLVASNMGVFVQANEEVAIKHCKEKGFKLFKVTV